MNCFKETINVLFLVIVITHLFLFFCYIIAMEFEHVKRFLFFAYCCTVILYEVR